MKKRIMSLLMSVIMVASMLAGCGSEAGSGARKGDTMTVSEMLDALVEDNGGEGIYFKSHGTVISENVHGYPLVYDGVTSVTGYTEETNYGNNGEDMSLGAFADIIRNNVVLKKAKEYRVEPLNTGLNLVTNEDGVVISESFCELIDDNGDTVINYITMTFNETNMERMQINDVTFLCFTYVDDKHTSHLIIPETESMVGKTIVMDTVGTDGVYVNLED